MDIVKSLNKTVLKRIVKAGTILLMMGSVAGCGASSAEKTVETVTHTFAVQEPKGNSEYESKTQIPGIFLDQTGFCTDSDKTVVFYAKEMPEKFSIIDLETKKTVYTGEIVKPVLDDKTEKYYGIGWFNDFKEPGTYYIFADSIGESFSTSIPSILAILRRIATLVSKSGAEISATIFQENLDLSLSSI